MNKGLVVKGLGKRTLELIIVKNSRKLLGLREFGVKVAEKESK